jgi:hypothetical protein
LFACSATPATDALLGEQARSVEVGGSTRTIRFLTSEDQLIARREVEIAFELSGPAESLPAALRATADMVHMKHGPSSCELRLTDGVYRGKLVFVMGGRWQLELFADDALILTGELAVREN